MTFSPEFRDHVLDLLAPLGAVRSKSMFGGAGLYLDGVMIALIADDILFFKVDDITRADFEAVGSTPFVPFPDKPYAMSYYQAPEDALENSEDLCTWARSAWEAARRQKKKKGPDDE